MTYLRVLRALRGEKFLKRSNMETHGEVTYFLRQ